MLNQRRNDIVETIEIQTTHAENSFAVQAYIKRKSTFLFSLIPYLSTEGQGSAITHQQRNENVRTNGTTEASNQQTKP